MGIIYCNFWFKMCSRFLSPYWPSHGSTIVYRADHSMSGGRSQKPFKWEDKSSKFIHQWRVWAMLSLQRANSYQETRSRHLSSCWVYTLIPNVDPGLHLSFINDLWTSGEQKRWVMAAPWGTMARRWILINICFDDGVFELYPRKIWWFR